ncbi:putative porin [uncultured Salinisphaera sp.]|uniref:putative porin n=1 Tax=uncultured Salinisphaera sp. TaxID=359372 RepID=UPI0032B2E00B|tara:strand:- start:2480 stop:3880 length:1401 start_codon:yes stop_codon:yes gene_type:complete
MKHRFASCNQVGARARHKRWQAIALAFAAVGVYSPTVFADDQLMQLIRIMRDNGSITEAQYQQLAAAGASQPGNQRDDAQPDLEVNAQRKRGGNATELPHPSTNQFVPPENVKRIAEREQTFEGKINDKIDAFDWASKIHLSGDLRLRYEYNDDSNNENAAGNNVARHRGRVRYRLGVIADPVDRLELGGGIASGGDDPRSTNQTFGDDFSSKPIRLDYAYAQYRFTDGLEAVGGKFRFGDYLWLTDDLIWDGDINPEGASVHYSFEEPAGATFANAGVWALQEFAADNSDPYLYYGQLGQHVHAGKLFASLAGTYYGYQNTAQPGTFDPDYAAGTNTTNQFQVVDVNGEVGTSFGDHGKASVFSEYVRNVHDGITQDTGYAIGSKLAYDKFAFKYIFGDLDANVVPDVFPDSDRDNGTTDMKGSEVEVGYALNTAIEFNLDYYNTQRKSIDQDDQLVQADINFRF